MVTKVVKKLFILVLCVQIIQNSWCQDISAFINSKKNVNIIDDKFISVVVDPVLLTNNVNINYRTLTLAKHLSPALVRIQGYSTSQLQSFNNLPLDFDNKLFNTLKLTPSMWLSLNEWFIKANLIPVFALSDQTKINGVWDPNFLALPLMKFADKLNSSCFWEIANDSPHKSFKQYYDEIIKLRHILETFPTKRNAWKIAGGDMSSCSLKMTSTEEINDPQKLIEEIERNVDAINWSPNLNKINFPEKIKKSNPKILKNNPAIWTTAPRSTNPTSFKDALIWAKFLGQSAAYGYSVIFRRPKIQEFYQLTPVFWVSLLHKKLMGQNVLDVRQMAINNKKKNCFIFAHNTKNDEQDMKNGITVMAVNMEDTEVEIKIKFLRNVLGSEIFKYILTSTNENSSDIYLNDSPLISHSQASKIKFMSNIQHDTRGKSICLNFPAKSIGFVVIPSDYIPSSLSNIGNDKIPKLSLSIFEEHSSHSNENIDNNVLNESEDSKTKENGRKVSVLSLVDDIATLIMENADREKKSILQMEEHIKQLATTPRTTIKILNYEEIKSNQKDISIDRRFKENQISQSELALVKMKRNVEETSNLVMPVSREIANTKFEFIYKELMNAIKKIEQQQGKDLLFPKDLLEIKNTLEKYHDELKLIMATINSSFIKHKNKEMDELEELEEENKILASRIKRKLTELTVNSTEEANEKECDLKVSLLKKVVKEQRKTENALEHLRLKQKLSKLENSKNFKLEEDITGKDIIQRFLERNLEEEYTKMSRPKRELKQGLELEMMKKYFDRQKKAEENADIFRIKRKLLPEKSIKYTSGTMETMKYLLDKQSKENLDSTKKIEEKILETTDVNTDKELKKFDQNILKEDNEIRSKREKKELTSKEVQAVIMEKYLENQKKAEKQAENYRKIADQAINQHIRRTRSMPDKFDETILEHSDSVEKTNDDNKTTKLNRRHSRHMSQEDDKTKEEDTFLNEISREEKVLSDFSKNSLDDYLVKPKVSTDDSINDDDSDDINTDDLLSKLDLLSTPDLTPVTTQIISIFPHHTKPSTISTKREKSKKKINKKGENDDDYHLAEDYGFVEVKLKEEECMIDNILDGVVEFLADMHRRFLDYLQNFYENGF